MTPGDETLTIAWSPPADDGGSAITSYDVRSIRSDALDKTDDANWSVREAIEISGSLPYALGGLTNGVPYDVGLRAVNLAGAGPWSTISTDIPRAAPGAPAIAPITPGDGALSITWTAPARDGGFAITAYDLRYIRSDAPDKGDANWTEATGIWIPGDLLEYRLNEATGFHNLENAVRYDVQVRAVSRQPHDVLVAGPWSASRTGTPGAVRRSPPSSGGGGGGGGGGFGPAPEAPGFADGFRTARGVAQNARPGDAVGDPVAATHPGDLEITYALSGADAASFTVDAETGQIRVKEGAALETGRTYTVNLTATDSAGFGAIIIVTVAVAEATHHPYDANRDGAIDREEVLAAVRDYFDGEVTKEEVLALIKLYFAEPG